MEKKYNELTINFVENTDICRVISCDKNAEKVVIPRVVDNHLVVAIKDYAFEDCKNLKSVTFEDVDELPKELYMPSIHYEIGSYAFSGCTSLKKIELPHFVRNIRRGAFYGCTSLKKATFFDCYVESYAFAHCTALKTVSSLKIINEGVFNDCQSLEVFPITNKTPEIDEDAFQHCYKLTDITIPKSVKSIEGLAFRSCRGLKTITFEDPENWHYKSMYFLEDKPVDFSDPEKNAKMLGTIDFDDGVTRFFKKDK